MLEACGFSDVAHVVHVVHVVVHFWSIGVVYSVGVWTKPHVGSVLFGIVSVVFVIRCVRSGGLVAPPLLWRECPTGLCYNFIVLSDFND